MEKLEKHIRQKLEGREITPSQGAWQKLEGSLGQKSKPKSKAIPIFWYGLAAVFIGLMISTLLYFGLGNNQTGSTKILDTVDIETTKGASNGNEVIVAKENERSSEEVSKNEVAPISPIKKETEVSEKTDELAEEIEREPLEDGFPKTRELLIEQKVNEVFAKVRLLESQNEAVTDAEVDSLLRAAQRDVMADKLFESNGSVDAMALLNEVEDELDKSFRDDIFNALKDGYTKLKTAVADRNH